MHQVAGSQSTQAIAVRSIDLQSGKEQAIGKDFATGLDPVEGMAVVNTSSNRLHVWAATGPQSHIFTMSIFTVDLGTGAISTFDLAPGQIVHSVCFSEASGQMYGITTALNAGAAINSFSLLQISESALTILPLESVDAFFKQQNPVATMAQISPSSADGRLTASSGPDEELFFTTMFGFNGTKPSPSNPPTLFLLGFSTASGVVLVRQEVANPFIDVEVLHVSFGGV